MPSARSRLGEPEEKLFTSRSTPSSVIVRMAPLPNCFSIAETASATAFCFWASTASPFPRPFPFVVMRPSSRLDGVMNRCAAERDALERRVARASGRELAAEEHGPLDGELPGGRRRRRHGWKAPALYPPEREVRAEGALLGGEALGDDRALDRRGERFERGRRLEAESDDARPPRRGEELRGPEAQGEGREPRQLEAGAARERGGARRIDVSEEAQRHVQRLRSHPAYAVAAASLPQPARQLRGRAPRGVAELDREEGANRAIAPHLPAGEEAPPRARIRVGPASSTPSSARRTQSSATCAVSMRWRGRSRGKTKDSAWVPSARASATCTRLTGFSGVPPPGPEMPVVATPRSAPKRRRAPSAIARATGSDTAPCRSRSSRGTPSRDSLAAFA